MKKTLANLSTSPDFQPLSLATQADLKGGWLWTCEEKRRTIGTYSYSVMVWSLSDDGKYGKTTVRM
jgi:hypothetical protein